MPPVSLDTRMDGHRLAVASLSLGPSIIPTKGLFKCINYIHFPDEAEIQRLRHLPKHVTMATWLWGDQSPFCQRWCQFIFLAPWLVIAFLSLSSVPLWTVHSSGAHTASE